VIVVLERGTRDEQVAEIVAELERRGLEVRAIRAGGKPALHVVGGDSARAHKALAFDEVEGLVATSGPRIRSAGQRFFPYHFVQWSAVGIVLLAVLTLLAGHYPPGLGAPIDVQRPPAQSVQPWYLRAPTAFVELFPPSLAWLGWLVVLALIGVVLLVPRFDRGTAPGLRGRWPAIVLVVAALGALFFPFVREVLS
jgi:hypothetical protein